MRIVSVLPSATEIVCALGGRRELVGRSAECDFPPDVAELPAVMRPRTLDGERPSAEIDRRVRTARAAGESLYDLDVGLLRSLRPDLLLTQDLCGVCSVTDQQVASACAEAGVRPEIVSLAPRTLDEVWGTFAVVGRAIDRPDEGDRLAATARARAGPLPASSDVRVAVVEWLDPPILAGLWTPDIVRVAGGVPLGPASGTPGERTTWEAVAALAPDLVVLSPCSFPVERTGRELAGRRLSERIGRLRPALGTFVADEAFFSRPGPRLAEGVDLVRGLLRGTEPRLSRPVVRWGRPIPEART